jgi:uncharacterized membrane protein
MKKTFYLLLIAAILLVATESLVHMHPYFEFEKVTGFYGLMAFGSYIFGVITMKFWRLLVKRPADYYDAPTQQEASE